MCGIGPFIVIVVLLLTDGDVCAEIYFQFLLMGALGGNNDHTVRGASTIDGSCRSVLQNGNVLNVVRVDGLDTSLDGQSVDNYQWVGLGLERADTTDSERALTAAVQSVLITHQTRDLTFQVFHDSTRVALIKFLGRDELIRTGSILTLDVLVTRYEHFVKDILIAFEFHHDKFLGLGSKAHILVLHTDISEFQLWAIAFYEERESTINISGGAIVGSFHHNGNAGQRIIILIGYQSRHLLLEVRTVLVGFLQNNSLAFGYLIIQSYEEEYSVEHLF